MVCESEVLNPRGLELFENSLAVVPHFFAADGRLDHMVAESVGRMSKKIEQEITTGSG